MVGIANQLHVEVPNLAGLVGEAMAKSHLCWSDQCADSSADQSTSMRACNLEKENEILTGRESSEGEGSDHSSCKHTHEM